MNNFEIDLNGNKIWTNNRGQQHNEYGPSVIYANGLKVYRINNQLHREDGPADDVSEERTMKNLQSNFYVRGEKIR